MPIIAEIRSWYLTQSQDELLEVGLEMLIEKITADTRHYGLVNRWCIP